MENNDLKELTLEELKQQDEYVLSHSNWYSEINHLIKKVLVPNGYKNTPRGKMAKGVDCLWDVNVTSIVKGTYNLHKAYVLGCLSEILVIEKTLKAEKAVLEVAIKTTPWYRFGKLRKYKEHRTLNDGALLMLSIVEDRIKRVTPETKLSDDVLSKNQMV